MNTKTITYDEISDLTVASLPTRPTADPLYGGEGYSAEDMKRAFDRLPLFIIERLNMLIEDAARLGEGSLSAEIPTGIREGHTLAQLFSDIENGNLASYIKIGGESLSTVISRLEERCGI
jgi:hypothetical protein